MRAADEMTGYDDLIYQPKSEGAKLVSWVISFVVFCTACFTIVTLFLALDQISSNDLKLSENIPNDRCVPLFDRVKAFVSSKSGTRALYDFRTGEAIVRVCSNETAAVVHDAIGVSHSYDPWLDTGCDVINNMEHRALFEQNCEFGAGFSEPYPDCGSVLNITPMPLGFHWNGWAVPLPEANTTLANGTIVTRGKCAMQLNINPDIESCFAAHVYAFHTIDTNVAVFMYLAVAVPFVVILMQLVATWLYAESGWDSEHGHMLAFANRGPSGSIYSLYWWWNEGEETEFGYKRGELPDVYLTFSVWLICAAQDATEGLAAPIVAVLGCSVQRFPVPLALIVVKGLKFIYDFVDYVRKRNLASEPGSEEGQHEFAKKELEEFYKSKDLVMPHNAHLANKAGTLGQLIDDIAE